MKGFTLIELVVSVAILGILASMAAPMGEVIIRRNKERELKLDLMEIRNALDAYKLSYDQGHIIRTVGLSGYPPSLQTLVDGIDDAKSPNGKKIYFLRRVPKDPFSPPNLTAEGSWGLRCYDSTAKEPKPGADVFDVYSMSEAVGLNGVPYKEW